MTEWDGCLLFGATLWIKQQRRFNTVTATIGGYFWQLRFHADLRVHPGPLSQHAMVR
jgi:hypothetical protein